MNTQQLVTTIKEDYAPDWSRTKILGYLDRAQKELFNQDCAQTTWLNRADSSFPIPILSTTAETLSYDITSDNLLDTTGAAVALTVGSYTIVPRKIKRVFIQASSLGLSQYGNLFYGEQFDWSGINDFWSKKSYRVSFYEIPGIPYDRTGLKNCSFTFSEDPGTYTDRYYVEFYYGPTDLSSESIPLSLNGDEWQEALIDGVRGYIEDSQFGRSDLLDRLRTYWKGKLKNSMNGGASHRKPRIMPMRSFG